MPNGVAGTAKSIADIMQETEGHKTTIPTLAPVGDEEQFEWGEFNFLIAYMTRYQPQNRVSLTKVKEEIKSVIGL